jgi:hypothetical protein
MIMEDTKAGRPRNPLLAAVFLTVERVRQVCGLVVSLPERRNANAAQSEEERKRRHFEQQKRENRERRNKGGDLYPMW